MNNVYILTVEPIKILVEKPQNVWRKTTVFARKNNVCLAFQGLFYRFIISDTDRIAYQQ